jgi:hypothetical protein
MYRWARFTHVLFATISFTAASFAQLVQIVPSQPALPQPAQLQAVPSIPAMSPVDNKTKADKEKEERARHQAALAMLDVVLAGTRNLSLPQNRIAIASDAFPILWSRNEAHARSLVSQMVGDFAQAASSQAENPERNARQLLRQQWQIVLREIASVDATLALSFMNATRTYVQIGNPEQEEAEERGLRLELAAQEATRNPRNALRIAEKDLQTPGDLPQELINLLSQVAAKDPEAGTQLLHDIVARVRGSDLAAEEANFNFALNLLNSQLSAATNGAAPDASLKTLADAVASAALNPTFPETTLPQLQASLPTFEQLAPARVQTLRQKVEQTIQATDPDQRSWDQFNEAQASGDPNQLLSVAEQAPSDVRSNMYQQVAWQLANNGDLQRARQVADKLPDPFQREQVLQQAIRQSVANAANQGQFATARQLAQEITSEEDRAILLAQVASDAANAKQEKFAQEILEEAGGLLLNRTPDASTFAAQLQVAQGFAHVKPARAVPLLERSASQLEQVLAAAIEMDGFLPYQRSFQGGELILTNSFLCNSLIRPYATATAELANSDLPAARILADRISLPEARLLAELFVVRSALGEADPQAGAVLEVPNLVTIVAQ